MTVNVPQWAPCAPLQPLRLGWLNSTGIEVAVLRLDLLDPLLSGNKWFKLLPHFQAAELAGSKGLISLGGPHSNHLHALAAAGQRFSFETVGLLRGEAQDTPTVRDLQAFGMHVHWLGYGGYRARHQADFWQPWLVRYPHLYPVDEGGCSLAAAQACSSIVEMAREQLPQLGWNDYDGWWLAAGTGTTLAGLVLAEGGQRMVHGALAVPAGHGVERNLAELLGAQAMTGYRLLDASRGGFARLDAELARFILATEAESGVPLESVYTAKALLALRTEVEAGYFARSTRLLFLHTGGLQGRRALAGQLQALAVS